MSRNASSDKPPLAVASSCATSNGVMTTPTRLDSDGAEVPCAAVFLSPRFRLRAGPLAALAPDVVENDGDVTGIDFSDAPSKAPKEFEVIPLIEGEGPKVKEGDSISVDYFGIVWGGKEPFDESYSREPASFGLTKGGLIDGWVQGLDGVTVGSRVMLVIPSELGYGEQGSPPDIPGGATLVFVVDVLGAGA